MKILGYSNINNKNYLPLNNQKSYIHCENEYSQLPININRTNITSFGALGLGLEIPNFMIQVRVRKLKKLGLSDFYAQRIARLEKEKYKKAIELISMGVFEESVERAIELDDIKYKQAIELVKHNVTNEDLASLASLAGESYKRVIELKDSGIDTEQVGLFVNLNEYEYIESKELMKKGYTPVEAACLAGLSEEQKEIALSLLNLNSPIEIASEIAKMEPEKRDLCIKLTERGISPEEAEPIANLEEQQKKRLDEIISMNVGDENIVDFAKFSDEHYQKALSLFKEGVLPEYISSIIGIEEGLIDNKEYEEYRKRGYSRSVSYSLSLLNSEEIKALSKIIKKNPQIKDLLMKEYDINIIELQNTDGIEAILSREIRCDNGTKITLVQTFDKNGNSTRSRVEEYSNHATSSIMSGASDVYKAKYDKYGEIKELSQFVQDPITHSVIGVIHSKASSLLPGVYESVYYDISEFITSNSNDDNEVDYDIEKSVKTNGIPISTVVQEKDGTIVYKEKFTRNGLLTSRVYKERKNEEGQIIYNYYSYNIKNYKDSSVLMDIQREYKKYDDNYAVYFINGIEYKLIYDDANKEITISDGKTIKKISFKEKLALYSQDILWEVIKTLPVDTLLIIDKNAKQWNYCREEDSAADGYSHTISTGKIHGVINHEAGHFKDYESEFSIRDENFLKTYNEEMQTFLNSTPFNEQEFVQYFTPRAMLMDATGTNEFAAETNIILTTYGTNYERLKTRSQFLARYFPKTIAITADLLGKTSKKSLLEED